MYVVTVCADDGGNHLHALGTPRFEGGSTRGSQALQPAADGKGIGRSHSSGGAGEDYSPSAAAAAGAAVAVRSFTPKPTLPLRVRLRTGVLEQDAWRLAGERTNERTKRLESCLVYSFRETSFNPNNGSGSSSGNGGSCAASALLWSMSGKINEVDNMCCHRCRWKRKN